MVKQNIAGDVGAGIAIEADGSAERVAVDNNELYDVAPGADAPPFALGIALLRAASVAVVGNTVLRVGQAVEGAGVRAGIVVLASGEVKVSGNTVDEIGPRSGYLGLGVGIGVFGPFDGVSVTDNSSRFSIETAGPSEGGWHALLVQSAAGSAVRFGTAKATVGVGDGAVVFTGGAAFAAASRSEHAGVTANALTGGGSLPTCQVRVRGDVVAQGNQCLHANGEPAGILLEGTSISASTNRVRGGESMLVLRVPENRFAALGNLAAGGTHLGGPGAGLPAPWEPLNPTVS
jgi:hypothetical protein